MSTSLQPNRPPGDVRLVVYARYVSIPSACLLACASMFVWAAPRTAQAEVVISEVAWMGSAEDANNEWIELANTGGEEVSLEGWSLTADDGQPAITLTGAVSAGGFFLLERTDDETVPGVTAGAVYTGAMGNDGEVLTLVDASGSVVDRVDGGEGWSLGGDNTAKYTLQRNGSGWITAEATPGRSNATEAAPLLEEEDEDDSTESTSETTRSVSNGGGSKRTTTSTKPAAKSAPTPVVRTPSLSVSFGDTPHGVAGVPLTLSASARNEKGEASDAEVKWTFGDGSTGKGTQARHTYAYPGSYVVLIEAREVRLGTTLTARAKASITISDLSVHLTKVDTYSIELHNTDTHELDLSGFYLVAGTHSFRIPQDTLLAGGAKVRFPATVTKLVVVDPHTVGVFTPHRTLAAQYGDSTEADVTPPTHEDEPEDDEGELGFAPADNGAQQLFTAESEVTSEEPESTLQLATVAEAFGGERQEPRTVVWYLLGLGAFAVTAVLSVMLFRREESEVLAPVGEVESLDDWELVEPLDTAAPTHEPARTRKRNRV